MRKLIAIAFVLLVAAPVLAQQQVQVEETDLATYLELLQEGVWETRGEVMGQAMDLSTDDAAKFWPVYREYEIEANKIAEARNQLIARYAEVFASLTDANANELAETSFTLDQQELQLRKMYFERMKEAMGAAKATRFAQIDNQLAMLIRLQIATQLPLMRKVQ